MNVLDRLDLKLKGDLQRWVIADEPVVTLLAAELRALLDVARAAHHTIYRPLAADTFERDLRELHAALAPLLEDTE